MGTIHTRVWLMLTMIWVGSGRSPPSWLNIFSKIGTMNFRTPVMRMPVNASTITGYVSALLILPRSSASFSKFVAMRSSAPSRKPPVSPARIIATISVGNTLSCLPSATDSAEPPSMSERTSLMAFCSLGLTA